MPNVSRVTFNSYAGPSIKGTESLSLDPNAGHWEKVLWLTSTVESGGKFGAITMYDGTAVTAGLHQAIAVYPKELADEDFNAADDQGSFWQLLNLFSGISDFPELQSLKNMFNDKGWVLKEDGSLRYTSDHKTVIRGQERSVKAGDLVFGFEIREVFTPNQGNVPAVGPLWESSKSWATAFFNVFSNQKSFRKQVEFGANHFENISRTKKIEGSSSPASIEHWLYGGDISKFKPPTPAYDLALSVFWSHSVNGPSIAYSILSQAIKSTDPVANPDQFARVLLSLLGRKQYGRWHFSEPNGRWQRTRSAAQHVWPKELFLNNGVMPSTL